ncbi:MAG: glycosyltransferase family 39 protein [Acidobacteriota bacterium]|nr:glycosyltransferase family 39 protein [Acidobacteriota bacterium]
MSLDLAQETFPALTEPRRVGARRSVRIPKRIDAVIVAFLAVAVGVVDASGLTRWPGFNGDEGIYTSQSWSVLHGSIEAYTYSYDHPFLGWAMMAPFEWLAETLGITGTGMAVLDARAVMVLLAVADAALLYGVACRLGFRRVVAAFTVLAWGWSPLTVSFARQVYLDNIALPFLLGALYLALDPARRQWFYVGAGAVFAVGVLSKETTLLYLPVLLYIVVQRTAGQVRVMAIASMATCSVAIIFLYPLFALLRGEFFPGSGHVSLWSEQIWAQLFSRAGSGSLWNVASSRFQLVDSWFHLDWWLPIAGLTGAVLMTAVARMRPIVVAVAISVAVVVKSSGYLPGMYIISVLPFLALCLGAVLNWLGGPAGAGKRRVTPRRVAAFTAVVALAVAMTPEYASGIRREATVNLVGPAEMADQYAISHIPHNANVLVDPIFYVDLIHHGFRHQWRGAIAYYQYDLDPESLTKLPGGWRDLDYLLVTPAMRDQISGKSVALPRTAAAIAHSRVVAVFGRGAQQVQVRKIIHSPSDTASVPKASS